MAKALAMAAFDYGQIEDKDIRSKLQYFAGTIKAKNTKGISIVFEIGADLMAAQEVLANCKNGIFLGWIAEEFGFSRRTAYNFISATKVFGDQNILCNSCTVSALYLLAADGCPAKATEEGLKLLKSGKLVTQKLAKELIAKNTIAAESEPVEDGEVESDEEPELEKWEQLAEKHATALNHLTQAKKCINWIFEQGEDAAYLAPVKTRIETDYKNLRGTISQNRPVGEKHGKIVTKVQDRR